VEALLESFRGVFAARDRALVVFGITSGFRASEILSLTRGDLINRWGEIDDRVTVRRTHMKGKRRSRTVDLNPQARLFLSLWLDAQAKLGLITSDRAVFGGRNGQPITYWRMLAILKRGYQAIGLQKRGYATHSLRKTFAENYYRWAVEQLRAGSTQDDPIILTCEALGHADIRATRQYLAFRKENVRDGVMSIAAGWELTVR
jgi:integrase